MARPSETVLAIGLSRKTCLPAAAAARVIARCTSFGVVLMIASISGSASIASKLAAGRQRYFAANFWRLSSERVKQARISSFPERWMASARTSDHHPIPMQPTRRGVVLTTFSLPSTWVAGCAPVWSETTRLLLPTGTNRLDGRLGYAQIRLPVTAADANPANTFAADQHRHTTFHGCPPLRPGGECKTDRMAHVEILTGCSLCC